MSESPNLHEIEKWRKRKVVVTGRDKEGVERRETLMASLVSIEEDLMTILEVYPVNRAVENLLDMLSALVTMTSSFRSTPTDREGRSSSDIPSPSVVPVWAERRLDQSAQRIADDAEAIAAWLHSPEDPAVNRAVCLSCGYKRDSGDLFCRSCGTSTVKGLRLCGLDGCGRLRKDCRHTGRDLGYSE